VPEPNVAAAHQVAALAILGVTIALVGAAAWSWTAARRTEGRSDHRFAVDRLVLAVEAFIALDVGLGSLLLVTGARPSDALHLLYGLAALVTLPVGWWWGGRPDGPGAISVRHRRDGRLLLAAAILVGIELRLVATG
jgi:hypothetical protein